jgi:endonuclease/exonuclease/phosphatase family metal-dependent hydrolase
VLLVNVHLSHLTVKEGCNALRALQLRTVLNRLTQMPQHDLTLVCGDFNASMESFELAPFMKHPWILVDAFEQSGSSEKVTCRTPDGDGLNLDHILCVPSRSRVTVDYRESAVVLNAPAQPSGVMPSDHAGVSVTLDLGSAVHPHGVTPDKTEPVAS